MKIRPTYLIPLIALCAPSASHALTEKGREALDRLQTLIVQESQEAGAQTAPDPRAEAVRQHVLQTLQGFLSQPETISPHHFAPIALQLASEESRRWLAVLQAEVTAELAEKARIWTEEFGQAHAKAAELVRQSEAAKDFDESIQTLESIMQRRPQEMDRNLAHSHSTILAFLKHWQEYLLAKESGNQQAARQAVQRIATMEVPAIFMPRSEWLRVVQAAKSADAPERTQELSHAEIEERAGTILTGVKELEDLGPALKKLRALPSSSGERPLAPLIQQLQFLDRNYQELKSGLPVSIDLRTSSRDGYSKSGTDVFAEHLARLKSAYLLRALPRFLGLPGEMALEPGESLVDGIRRVAQAQGNDIEPSFLLRCQEALSALQYGNINQPGVESAGAKAYLTARNQEAAGQHEEAVLSYLEALRSNNELLPVEEIGKRLRALEKTHPEAYARGVLRSQSMPARGPEAENGLGQHSTPSPRRGEKADPDDDDDDGAGYRRRTKSAGEP